ncbi:MAG: ion transporter, partial [Psychromonas sp.]|nr:ion transporter [Psychromonas sp.]
MDKTLISAGNSALQRRFYEIRNNKFFELFVISIIIFSALMIGANSYDTSPTMMKVLSVLDITITIIFLIEIVIRFIGEPNKRRFFHNFWNIFDTFIVIVSLIPIEDGEMA